MFARRSGALVTQATSPDVALTGRGQMRRTVGYATVALLLLTGLALANRPGFLVFHSFAEIFVIVIALSTGLIAWNARVYLDNDYLLFIGIGQMFVAVLDVFHLLAFRGMDVFAAGGPPLSTETWIAARYLSAASLLVAPLFIRRRIPLPLVFALFTAATALLVASIFTGVFPVCYDQGLTPFKIVSEFVIAFLYAAAAALLFANRASFDSIVLKLIFASILLRSAAELMFAVYTDVSDAYSFAGHYIRIIAFFCLYKAILETGVVRPYAILLRDLRDREQELRTTIQELDAFSVTVSHDLRSPLTAVSGFAQLLEAHEDERLTEDGRAYLGQIRSNVGRMSELIDDLLAFSRASRADITVEAVDVTAMGREIMERLRKMTPDRDVSVDIEEGMVGRADPRLLRVALENLLGNAWKFTSKKAAAQIALRNTRDSREQVFSVRDDGAGFDTSQANGRLFRPFQRLHAASEFEGTGVGLATVARIIERHHGRIWAESERGKGTTVYFTLPS